MRIHVTRRISPQALSQLYATGWDIFVGPEEEPSRPRLLWAVAGSVGLLTLPSDRIDAEVMDLCPALRVISQCGASLDNIDLEEARRRGVAVRHTPEPAAGEATPESAAEDAVRNLIAALAGPAH